MIVTVMNLSTVDHHEEQVIDNHWVVVYRIVYQGRAIIWPSFEPIQGVSIQHLNLYVDNSAPVEIVLPLVVEYFFSLFRAVDHTELKLLKFFFFPILNLKSG